MQNSRPSHYQYYRCRCPNLTIYRYHIRYAEARIRLHFGIFIDISKNNFRRYHTDIMFGYDLRQFLGISIKNVFYMRMDCIFQFFMFVRSATRNTPILRETIDAQVLSSRTSNRSVSQTVSAGGTASQLGNSRATCSPCISKLLSSSRQR